MEIIMSNNSNLLDEPILNQVNNLLNGIQFTYLKTRIPELTKL